MPDISETENATPVFEMLPVEPALEAPAPELEVPEVAPEEEEVAGHVFLLKDINVAIDRVKRSRHLGETRKEFEEEVYPLIKGIVEYFGDQLTSTQAALAEVIDQSESVVHEDLAALIAGALNLGKALATVTQSLRPGVALDAKSAGKLHVLATQYLQAAEEAGDALANVTIEDAGDEEEEG